jgi:acyl carrier protein
MTTLERLTELFREVFDDPEMIVTEHLSAKDVDDWDSLTHIQLISRIEKAFQLRFTMAEIASLKEVGDLIKLIAAKNP